MARRPERSAPTSAGPSRHSSFFGGSRKLPCAIPERGCPPHARAGLPTGGEPKEGRDVRSPAGLGGPGRGAARVQAPGSRAPDVRVVSKIGYRAFSIFLCPSLRAGPAPDPYTGADDGRKGGVRAGTSDGERRCVAKGLRVVEHSRWWIAACRRSGVPLCRQAALMALWDSYPRNTYRRSSAPPFRSNDRRGPHSAYGSGCAPRPRLYPGVLVVLCGGGVRSRLPALTLTRPAAAATWGLCCPTPASVRRG